MSDPLPIPRRRESLPAWFLSVAIHVAMLLMLFFASRHVAPGIDVEPDRTAGITLVKHARGEREYFDENDLLATDQLKTATPGVQSPFPSRNDLELDVSSLLPSVDAAGAGTMVESPAAAPRAGDLGGGTAKSLDVGGGTARTEVFGVYGTGSRFVYVFDRSGSMSGHGGRPLAAAKRELRSSLGDLDRVHQFQIIFYNQRPAAFHPHGDRPRLEWADDATKELARAFVDGITASGGTRHMGAMQLAIGMQPDVIFFLTDAEHPQLSAADLRKIRRLNAGAAIHAVEFGFGPQRTQNNFLMQLAEQNGGKHVYVDVSRLPKP